MKKKWFLLIFICFFSVIQPFSVQAADKHVSDCLDDDEDCGEETNGTVEKDTDSSEPMVNTKTETMEPGSFALNIVKMIFALLLILALIYALLWFLKKRRSYEQVGALENIGGISVGQNKSVQIIRVGATMYLLGVGENVELLKELSEEEIERVTTGLQESSSMPAASILQGIFQTRKQPNYQSSNNHTSDDFHASFQNELDKLKKNRHQMIDSYEKKDDRHE